MQTDNKLLRGWIILGVASLAIAGILTLWVAGMRIPVIQEIMPFKDFFRTALIIHVNLSVLVWLSCISIAVWRKYNNNNLKLGKIALYICSIAVFLMAISPFTALDSKPLLNNYIPILQNDIFFLSLILFAIGITIEVFANLSRKLLSTQIIAITALICFMLSFLLVDRDIYNPHDYFEIIFWGGGHIMQMLFASIMVVIWLIIANKNDNKYLKIMFAVNAIMAISAIAIYVVTDIYSYEHIYYFTQHMIYFAGFLSIVCLPLVIKKGSSPAHYALYSSIILFFIGGLISLFISGVNTIIPAHYHGSVVGVTIAMMGFVYYIMPQIGGSQISSKWAKMQPVIYAVGQILHITGMAVSGGYGALRKNPELIDNPEIKAAMGVMGLGSMLTLLAGVMFVVIIYRSFKR